MRNVTLRVQAPIFFFFFNLRKKKNSFISTHPTSTSHRDVSVMSVEYERLKTNCRSNPFTPLWLEENTTSRVIISTQKMINMAKKFVRKTFSEGCFWRVYASFLKPHDLSVVLRIFCIVWLSRKIFLPSYFFLLSILPPFFSFHLFHLWLAKWHAYEGRRSNFLYLLFLLVFSPPFLRCYKV